MPEPALRLMVIGAHPDDADYKAGGLAALYRKAGHEVLLVSVTDGSAGHQQEAGPLLALRRRAEAAAAGAVIGAKYDVWRHPDGRLVGSLEIREQVIRAIRSFRPDLLLTHRPNDYHPDHRVVSQMVQDAAYLLTVPAICPDVPFLKRDPVIAYLSDDFQRPWPFDPCVVLNIADVWEDKVAMLHSHTSQFYEWLPFNGGYSEDVPAGEAKRKAWLSARLLHLSGELAHQQRETISAARSSGEAAGLDRVEAFEGCEYGAPLDVPACLRLFPFGERRTIAVSRAAEVH